MPAWSSREFKLIAGCDHAGLLLKNQILGLNELQGKFVDLGVYENLSVDYPDIADKVVTQLLLEGDPQCFGLLICGSGQGMAMRANRFRGIRAALCWTPEVAELSRKHNNANILCLGGRVLQFDSAVLILKSFLETSFEGGRHLTRVQKMDCI